jgi:hypothetical protein
MRFSLACRWCQSAFPGTIAADSILTHTIARRGTAFVAAWIKWFTGSLGGA